MGWQRRKGLIRANKAGEKEVRWMTRALKGYVWRLVMKEENYDLMVTKGVS